jgi:hypothetical protein
MDRAWRNFIICLLRQYYSKYAATIRVAPRERAIAVKPDSGVCTSNSMLGQNMALPRSGKSTEILSWISFPLHWLSVAVHSP